MEKVFFNNFNGEKICGVIEEVTNKDEIFVIVHGYSSNKEGGAKNIAEELANNGINSLRIDLDDCGESEPKFEFATISKYIETVKSAIDFCKERRYNEVSLIGTSTGGLVVMATILKYPIVKSLILRAPSSDNDEDVLTMEGEEGLKSWKEKGYIFRVKKNGLKKKIRYDFVEDGHQYSMYDKVKNIKIPILILQGTVDKEVDPEGTKRLAKNFPNAKLLMIEGGDHSLGIEGDYKKSLNAIVDWIKNG